MCIFIIFTFITSPYAPVPMRCKKENSFLTLDCPEPSECKSIFISDIGSSGEAFLSGDVISGMCFGENFVIGVFKKEWFSNWVAVNRFFSSLVKQLKKKICRFSKSLLVFFVTYFCKKSYISGEIVVGISTLVSQIKEPCIKERIKMPTL